MLESSPGNCLVGAEGRSASSRLVPGLRKPAHDAHQADHLLSKKQPQENTPRPMACSHVGHAATEAHSQQEDTWRPTLQGQVPRCNAK